MSIDRKYFRYAEKHALNPGFGSLWEVVNPGSFYALVEDPTNSAITSVNSTVSGVAGAKQIAALGWIGDPITADRLLDGSVKFRMRARENADTNDSKLALQILVVSGDGTTVRGQLFYGTSSAELTTTLTATDIQGNLDAINAFAGDRLVAVVGFDTTNAGTGSLSHVLSVGDSGAANDLSLGSQLGDRPYIEFTWDDPPLPPDDLSLVEAKPRSIEVSWTPEGAVDGYQVRINGGVTVDTLAQTHTFNNLDDNTNHLIEVRSTLGAQYSTWTFLEVTTPVLQVVVKWDDPNQRLYQTGCDRGALYFDDGSAVAWNGLTGVDETGTGTASVLYRDGEIYYSDIDPSDFTATIKAFFWPDRFGKCLGIPEITDGLYVDNQKPRKFNMTYRNLIGSGGKGDRFGYQIHLVYNALANIGTRTRKTRTNQVQLDEFSFDIIATPVKMPGLRPSAHYIIDTRNMDKPTIKQLESILYREGRLPEPQELYDLMNFGDAITFIDHGDGTWTARGSSENLIDRGDGTWIIRNVNGTDNGDGTFVLEDTPA